MVRTPGFHPGNRGSIPRRGTKIIIMANHKSALKRIKQSETRRLQNKYKHKTARNAVRDLKSTADKKEAIKFLEFLSNAKSQETFGNVNHEYPVMIETNQSSLLKSWGSFKYDSINLSILGANNSEAVKLFDRAGWE